MDIDWPMELLGCEVQHILANWIEGRIWRDWFELGFWKYELKQRLLYPCELFRSIRAARAGVFCVCFI